MLGLGLALTNFGTKGGISDAADGGGYSLASLPNLAALYEPYNLATVFLERTSPTTPASVDGVVGNLQDQTGNVRHLTTSADSRRPVLRESGTFRWLEFDGVDDFLRLAFTLPQPYTRITLLRQTSWTVARYLLDGGTNLNHRVTTSGSSPSFYTRLTAGALTTYSPTLGDWFVLTEVANGASSKSKLNNGSFTGVSWATTPDLSGITVGAAGDGNSSAAINMGGMVLCSQVLTDDDIAAAVTFLGAKAGLTI